MVVDQGDTFHFVPSNPWVAVGWRKRGAIKVKLPPVMTKRGIDFTGIGRLASSLCDHPTAERHHRQP